MATDHDPFITALIASADADLQVVGLVLVGSTAQPSRRDQWSDHDFLLITAAGTQEDYRTDLSWLPDHHDIAFWLRETPHGLKVLYRSGLLVEFAVFDKAEFAECALNHYEVAIDHGGVAGLSAQVQARSLSPRTVDRLGEFHNFLCLVYIATGRARRGELLSANAYVNGYATEHLLRLLRDLLPPEQCHQFDALDIWRRFETADPALGAAIGAALARPAEEAARRLLEVADTELAARWPDYPAGETQLVRTLLGW